MKTKYKVILSYEGANYYGWQKQSSTDQTIQTQFEQALSKIFKSEVRTIASGRTDAKVHALQLHVVFDAPFFIESEKLQRAINTYVPDEILCLDVRTLSESLMPTSDAKSRSYIYLFSVAENKTPFQKKLMTHIKYELDIEKMQRAARLFEGVHDFKSFMSTGSTPASTVREVFETRFKFVEPNMHGIFPAHYAFEITANGFLKQMVRHVFGALVEVGRGKIDTDEIEQALRLADGKHIAPCAAPEGLYKLRVEY